MGLKNGTMVVFHSASRPPWLTRRTAVATPWRLCWVRDPDEEVWIPSRRKAEPGTHRSRAADCAPASGIARAGHAIPAPQPAALAGEGLEREGPRALLRLRLGRVWG